MKKILLFVALCASTTIFATEKCDFDFKKYCATVEFSKKPSRSYSSDFKLIFKDKKTKKVVIPSEKISSYLWMKMDGGHEHGSDKVEISKMKDHFKITNVWFVMVGNWKLFVSLSVKDAELEKKSMIVKIGK
jgi:hypothetical protein